MKRNIINGLSMLFIALIVGVVGCSDPEPPSAVITVVGIDEVPIEGATVRIFCVPGTGGKAVCREEVEEIELTTDGAGKVRQDFDLNMVLRVEAYIDYPWTYIIDSLPVDSSYRFAGSGNLKLEYDVVTDEKITLLGSIPE